MEGEGGEEEERRGGVGELVGVFLFVYQILETIFEKLDC